MSTKERFEYFAILIGIISGLVTIFQGIATYGYILLAISSAFIFFMIYNKNKTNFMVKWQSTTISIYDSDGSFATYKNESCLNAIKPNSQRFQYTIYTDGKIENISSETGLINKVTTEGGRTIIDTCLKYPLKKEEDHLHIINCNLIDSFKNKNEYWETTRYTPGTNITITIFFPTTRVCKSFRSLRKIGAKTEKTNIQPILTYSNNKPCLVFKIKQVKLLETFRIEWEW